LRIGHLPVGGPTNNVSHAARGKGNSALGGRICGCRRGPMGPARPGLKKTCNRPTC
jgi:hypothetical protein